MKATSISPFDVNVAGTKSFPVADILRQRGMPFTFATGYGVEGLMDGYQDFPALRKPYAPEDLERAIASLPARARNALILHDIHGFRCREVAEITGTAAGTIQAHLHRARKLLRERLGR